MANVRMIPANRQRGGSQTDNTETPKLRVAAYCRVSTESDEQATSYEAQIEHYTEYIKANPAWTLAGIYADDGISGTNTKKREEFNRLMEDCMNGSVDMVITKSISRFARNTVDCLQYIRKLKDRNIPVYFEKENINTLDAKGEVLLTIMASLAQQESESLSQNVKLGLQFRYQQGKVQVNHSRFLGYDKDEDGKLVVNQAEAEIVKRIYREYLEGKSYYQIGQDLTTDGIKTAAGSEHWHASTLKKILQNEKYIGDALLQKTVTTDYLTKKRVVNKGYVPQYYVEGSHEAIIPRELYMQVQEEMVRRARLQTGTGKRRVYSGKYALSSKVYCGHCGDLYQRTHWDIRGRKEIVWRCVSRLRKSEVDCPARTVKETELQRVVVAAVNELIAEKDGLLTKVQTAIAQGLTVQNKEKIAEVDQQLESLEKELIDKASTGEECKELTEQIDALQMEKQKLLLEEAGERSLHQRMREIAKYLREQETAVAEYDEGIVRKLIEKITLYDDRCDVEFKSGIIVEVYV